MRKQDTLEESGGEASGPATHLAQEGRVLPMWRGLAGESLFKLKIIINLCRRDTSEESGGEASGSSPTAGAGRPRALRKTASKNRHRRPPLRAPAFEVWLYMPAMLHRASDMHTNPIRLDIADRACGAPRCRMTISKIGCGSMQPAHLFPGYT